MEMRYQIEVVPNKEIWNAIKDNYEYETKRQKKKSQITHVKREVSLE